MTATELYEIVQDHRDVWGKVLAFCDYNDASYWASRVMRGDYSIQCSDSTSEAALLGLGVKWLADTTTEFHSECHDRMYLVPARKLTVPQDSFLAAVYAAIAEVKKESPNG